MKRIKEKALSLS